MFHGARNVMVQGGLFVANVHNNSTNSRLDRLFAEVAPNAILNAGGRADEVRCYPGTREEVIGKMEKWMNGEGNRTSRMMWLSGPAGAGKSAILQTVAERCQEDGRHASNFFFFRGDGTRNHAQPLVATLVCQLRTLYATFDKPLEVCLEAMPLICKASIGEQFKKLISAPVHTVQGSSSICHPIILIIDGLDECEDKQEQEKILVALHALVDKDNSPFLVLVASRAEPHIVMSINKIASSVASIFLDDEYRPQDDIRRFVTAKFDEIKGSHHLAHTLDEHWPSEFDIYRVVENSSGQFIYAATIMRFIQYSAASPSLSLLTVHGIRPAANHSPYTQLDALYSYILSNSHNIQAVKLCFGLHFIWRSAYDQDLEHALEFKYLVHRVGFEQIDISSLFADLVSIVSVDTDPYLRLNFHHASLSDYLVDKSRAGIYHVDVRTIATELSTLSLQTPLDLNSWTFSVAILQYVRDPTPALTKALLEASTEKFHECPSFYSKSYVWKVLMMCLYGVYFASDLALYKQMLQRWIRFAYRNNINDISIEDLVTGAIPLKNMRRDIHMHYHWYLLTEKIKHVLTLYK